MLLRKPPNLKPVGRAMPSILLASITVFPIDFETCKKWCLDVNNLDFNNFSISVRSRVLL